MTVSIVIPCYNEKDTIGKVVEAVRNAPLNSKEIIVVDDCSVDGTQTLLREKVALIVLVMMFPINRGCDETAGQKSVQINRIDVGQNNSRFPLKPPAKIPLRDKSDRFPGRSAEMKSIPCLRAMNIAGFIART